MDHVEQLGEMALVSRMKRLAERMHQDNALIFREWKLPFEPRWFLILSLLDKHDTLSIMEVARELKITHPTVNQLAKEIMAKGFIAAAQDPLDKRKRLLRLTNKGRVLLESLRPFWEDMTAAAREVMASCGYDVISVLAAVERVLDEQNYHERIRRHIRLREWQSIEILAYAPRYRRAFQSLSREWFEAPLLSEETDRGLLDAPQQKVLNPGGFTLLARLQGEIVGTCSLAREKGSTFKWIQLWVTEKHRGKQIGRKLATTAIEKAKSEGAGLLLIELHHQLRQAITWCRQVGFVSTPFSKLADHKPEKMLMKLDLAP